MNTRNAFGVLLVLLLLVIPGPDLRRERSVSCPQPPVHVDPGVFDERLLGMSVEEVIAAVGASPGDYRTPRGSKAVYLFMGGRAQPGVGPSMAWQLDCGLATVWFREGRASAVWCWDALPEPLPVKLDLSALDKLEVGMTEAQVTAILGVPPGDYSSGPWRTCTYLYGESRYYNPREDPGTPKESLFNSRIIIISFKDGKAHRIQFARAMRELNWIERTFQIPMGPAYEPDE